MKKTKLFSVLAVFAAMTLVACNGGNNSESSAKPNTSGSKSQQPTTSSSKAPTWGDWTVKTPATCAAEGVEERTNTNGEKETRPIPKSNIHTWTDDGDVEASNGGVAYKKVKCSVCQKKGIMISAAAATITGGTPKSAPEGCIKLNANGDYMEVKFYLPEAKTGVILQRGSMDYWYEDSNNNQNKTYYSQNSGNTDEAAGVGNFKLEVGLEGAMQEVSIADKTTVTFGDMLPEEGAFEFGGHQWSAIGDCEVGAVTLAAGLNTIKYTRVDSYNLAVHDFVIAFNA